MSVIDLHMHSIYSDDGEFSIKQLLETAKQNQVKVIAITDHNSVQGVQEGLDLSSTYGIKVIPGIEIDCNYNGIDLHILGYQIQHNDPRYKELEAYINNTEREASKIRVQKTIEMGIEIDENEVWKLARDGVVTGEMIGEVALAIDNQKVDKNPMLTHLYASENPLVDFYWSFYGQGKPGYTKIEYMSLKEAIHLIKDTGGIPVFAHPGKNIGMDSKVLKEIIELGVKGIEAFSSYHSKEEVQYFLDQALELGAFVTCGSDYHGKTKPAIQLGTFKVDFDSDALLDNLKTKLKFEL